MANHLKGERLARLTWALRQGWSVRAAARYSGCSNPTACRHVRLAGGRVDVCPCGKAAKAHRGWCWWRYQQSEKRQAFIAQWRPDLSGPRVRRATSFGEPRTSVPKVWPFVTGTPTDDHGLVLAINTLVPKWIAEQVRQDVCQDIAVRVLTGDALTADLVRDVLKAGRRAYGLRWDEISLGGYISRSTEGLRWSDALSPENPIQRFRPLTEPRTRARSRPAVPLRVARGYTRGEASVRAKLSEADVLAMRHMYHSGRYTQTRIAREFGVSQATVFNILVGGQWAHVGGPIYMPEKDQASVAAFEAAGCMHATGSRAWNKRGGMPQATGFDQFWAMYPKRVAKLAAMKAYERARWVASDMEILAGLKKYNANLPDDPRFIAHAASWLNAGRWMDEYDVAPAAATNKARWCEHEPQCYSPSWHAVVIAKERGEAV